MYARDNIVQHRMQTIYEYTKNKNGMPGITSEELELTLMQETYILPRRRSSGSQNNEISKITDDKAKCFS